MFSLPCFRKLDLRRNADAYPSSLKYVLSDYEDPAAQCYTSMKSGRTHVRQRAHFAAQYAAYESG